MKSFRSYCLIALLLIFRESYAQTVTCEDLIGFWNISFSKKWNWHFLDCKSVITTDSASEKSKKYKYNLYTIGDKTVMQTIYKSETEGQIVESTIRKITKDSIEYNVTVVKYYISASDKWVTNKRKPYISYLIRRNN